MFSSVVRLPRCWQKVIVLLLFLLFLPGYAAAEPSLAPDEGGKPLTVRFSFPGGEAFDELLWSFGDGSVSSEANPNHTYTDAGIFYPKVSGSLPGGEISYAFGRIFVTPVPMPHSGTNTSLFPKSGGVNIGYSPLSEEERIRQASVLNQLGYPDYAAASYERLFAKYGLKAEPLVLYARTLRTLGSNQEALTAYSRSLSLSDNASIWAEYGAALREAGRYNESADAYNHSLNKEAGNASIWNEYGDLLMTLARNAEAEEAHSRSLSIPPVPANYS